ncbi:hypothetical protein DFJ74DRAFT_662612 [Hyaloraphidium curvatum]|nr:hypothetical protein DFJ74DRAFT_662612 [Hyaloraphidium curvatum]
MGRNRNTGGAKKVSGGVKKAKVPAMKASDAPKQTKKRGRPPKTAAPPAGQPESGGEPAGQQPQASAGEAPPEGRPQHGTAFQLEFSAAQKRRLPGKKVTPFTHGLQPFPFDLRRHPERFVLRDGGDPIFKVLNGPGTPEMDSLVTLRPTFILSPWEGYPDLARLICPTCGLKLKPSAWVQDLFLMRGPHGELELLCPRRYVCENFGEAKAGKCTFQIGAHNLLDRIPADLRYVVFPYERVGHSYVHMSFLSKVYNLVNECGPGMAAKILNADLEAEHHVVALHLQHHGKHGPMPDAETTSAFFSSDSSGSKQTSMDSFVVRSDSAENDSAPSQAGPSDGTTVPTFAGLFRQSGKKPQSIQESMEDEFSMAGDVIDAAFVARLHEAVWNRYGDLLFHSYQYQADCRNIAQDGLEKTALHQAYVHDEENGGHKALNSSKHADGGAAADAEKDAAAKANGGRVAAESMSSKPQLIKYITATGTPLGAYMARNKGDDAAKHGLEVLRNSLRAQKAAGRGIDGKKLDSGKSVGAFEEPGTLVIVLQVDRCCGSPGSLAPLVKAVFGDLVVVRLDHFHWVQRICEDVGVTDFVKDKIIGIVWSSIQFPGVELPSGEKTPQPMLPREEAVKAFDAAKNEALRYLGGLPPKKVEVFEKNWANARVHLERGCLDDPEILFYIAADGSVMVARGSNRLEGYFRLLQDWLGRHAKLEDTILQEIDHFDLDYMLTVLRIKFGDFYAQQLGRNPALCQMLEARNRLARQNGHPAQCNPLLEDHECFEIRAVTSAEARQAGKAIRDQQAYVAEREKDPAVPKARPASPRGFTPKSRPSHKPSPSPKARGRAAPNYGIKADFQRTVELGSAVVATSGLFSPVILSPSRPSSQMSPKAASTAAASQPLSSPMEEDMLEVPVVPSLSSAPVQALNRPVEPVLETPAPLPVAFQPSSGAMALSGKRKREDLVQGRADSPVAPRPASTSVPAAKKRAMPPAPGTTSSLALPDASTLAAGPALLEHVPRPLHLPPEISKEAWAEALLAAFAHVAQKPVQGASTVLVAPSLTLQEVAVSAMEPAKPKVRGHAPKDEAQLCRRCGQLKEEKCRAAHVHRLGLCDDGFRRSDDTQRKITIPAYGTRRAEDGGPDWAYLEGEFLDLLDAKDATLRGPRLKAYEALKVVLVTEFPK